MISDEQVQLALRGKALSLAVATTGSISMSASANGGEQGKSAFIRAAGSFLTDNLRIGMEAQAAGFALNGGVNNGPATITALSTDGRIATVNRLLQTEVAAAGRSLVVGFPALVSWENVSFDQAKAAGRPWVQEQYAPGTGPYQHTQGSGGLIVYEPTYILNLYVPAGGDIGGDSKYTDALHALFPPGLAIAVTGQQEPLRVRRDIAPRKSQRQFAVDGYVAIPFSIPSRILTPNSI